MLTADVTEGKSGFGVQKKFKCQYLELIYPKQIKLFQMLAIPALRILESKWFFFQHQGRTIVFVHFQEVISTKSKEFFDVPQSEETPRIAPKVDQFTSLKGYQQGLGQAMLKYMRGKKPNSANQSVQRINPHSGSLVTISLVVGTENDYCTAVIYESTSQWDRYNARNEASKAEAV